MIKAVLFDYDGVLSVTANKSSLSDAIAAIFGTRIGWDKLDDLHNDLSRGKITADEFFASLAHRHQSKKKLTEAMWDRQFPDIAVRAEPMYALANELRSHGIRTGILSNMYHMTAVRLKTHGNYDKFAPIILSCDVGLMKPELKMYQLALAMLGLPAAEVLLVDDREKCLAPAEQLGMHVVLATETAATVRSIRDLITQENGITL